MDIHYSKSDMCLRHYIWTTERRKERETQNLDAQVLNIMQGNDVLMFANAFLNKYLPGHTIHNLHSLEHALLEHRPNYLVTKRQIAHWLAENEHLYTNSDIFTPDTQLQNTDLEFEM